MVVVEIVVADVIGELGDGVASRCTRGDLYNLATEENSRKLLTNRVLSVGVEVLAEGCSLRL